MLLAVGLLTLASLPAATQAGPYLPSRDTPTPTRVTDDAEDKDPVGAYLELRVSGASSGAWSVVQWQDDAGGWHDVEGWQGTLDASGQRRWWVAAKDFGKGPFRWAVYDGPGGLLVGTSQAFQLPDWANQVLRTEVSIP